MIHRLIALDYPEQVIPGIIESTVLVRTWQPAYRGPVAFGGQGRLWATGDFIDIIERAQGKDKEGNTLPPAWYWKFSNLQYLAAKIRCDCGQAQWERDSVLDLPMVPAQAQRTLNLLAFTDEPNACGYCGAAIDTFGRCTKKCFPLAVLCVGRPKVRCATCGELCALCPDEDKKPQLFDPRTGSAHACVPAPTTPRT